MWFYSIVGKKNNQSSVSDADREIPTLESTDNVRNSVNLVFCIIHFPVGLGFLCLHDWFYLTHPETTKTTNGLIQW